MLVYNWLTILSCVVSSVQQSDSDTHIKKKKRSCFSGVWIFVTLWTIACQAPQSMGFSRQEYWNGLPFPSPEYLPDPGIEPESRGSCTAGRFFTAEPPGKPRYTYTCVYSFSNSFLSYCRELSQVPFAAAAAAAVASVVSDSVRPQRRQPTRLPRPWDSPGKNTGVGCHFLLQCMNVKVKLLSRVQLLASPWTAAYQDPPSMGCARQEYWSGLPLSSPQVPSAAAAAKSLQSCPTLCDSPPGSPVPGILQARTLEWVAISFSSAWKWKVKVKSLSRVPLLGTPWTAAHQAPPSMGFSRQEYWSGVPLPSPQVPSTIQ